MDTLIINIIHIAVIKIKIIKILLDNLYSAIRGNMFPLERFLTDRQLQKDSSSNAVGTK